MWDWIIQVKFFGKGYIHMAFVTHTNTSGLLRESVSWHTLGANVASYLAISSQTLQPVLYLNVFVGCRDNKRIIPPGYSIKITSTEIGKVLSGYY